MTFRSVLRLLIWVVVIGYLAYVVVAAASNYFDMVDVLESAGQKAVQKERWVVMRQPDAPIGDYTEEVRSDVLRGAEASGVVVDAEKLIVVQADMTLRISVKWSHPAIRVGGETILAIPLTMDRAFDLRP